MADLQEGDFWEGVNAQGAPYREADGVLYSDPGHALEFVGLALKFIATAQAKATPDQTERLRAAQRPMTTLLERNFANGYIADPGGISKAFDLVSRRHLNTDMPWWNLTRNDPLSRVRTASRLCSGAERTRCLRRCCAMRTMHSVTL